MVCQTIEGSNGLSRTTWTYFPLIYFGGRCKYTLTLYFTQSKASCCFMLSNNRKSECRPFKRHGGGGCPLRPGCRNRQNRPPVLFLGKKEWTSEKRKIKEKAEKLTWRTVEYYQREGLHSASFINAFKMLKTTGGFFIAFTAFFILTFFAVIPLFPKP